MKKNKQLSLAQALGDLSRKELEKLIGLKVIFIKYRRTPGNREVKQKEGVVVSLSKTPGYVIIEDSKGNLSSRSPSQIWEAL